jgi:DNA-binding MarR family transcriptional regulator
MEHGRAITSVLWQTWQRLSGTSQMSNDKSKKALIERIGSAIPAMQNATQDVDAAAAAALGVNLTDLRCLGILLYRENIPANELAVNLRLSRGAVTALLDRLAKAGLAERRDDPNDRRGVLVAATPYAQKRVRKIWSPIQAEGKKILSACSEEDLRVIGKFLGQVRTLQMKHAERINAAVSPSKVRKGPRQQ